MVKVKLTDKLDSDVLVVGFGTVNKKLKIESGSSQIDTATLLATLTAMGATGKADEIIKLPADTICIHGDGQHAIEMAKAIYTTLKDKAIEIKYPQ